MDMDTVTKVYRLNSTGYGSARYGNCEICGKPADTIYLLACSEVWGDHIFSDSTAFGHKECLAGITRRRHENI